MTTRFWIILAAVIVCVIVALGIAEALDGGIPVEVAVAQVGPIREFVDERAQTRLPQTYVITMPATGRLEAIQWEEGMAVAKDQIVAQIVPRDLELDLQQASAAVQRLDASIRENADVNVEETAFLQAGQFVKSMAATVQSAAARVLAGKAKVDYAEKDLGRVQRLVASKARAEADLDRAKLEHIESGVDLQQDELVHAAMVAMQAATDLMPTMVRQFIDRKGLNEDVLLKEKAEATARLRQAEQNQSRGTMRSPVDGMVLKRLISNERYLSAGQELLEIGRLEELQVEAEVLSVDVVDVKRGDQVEIYGPAIGQTPASGTVARVYPAGFTKVSSLGVEQQRVNVIIDFDPADLTRLRQQRQLGVGYRVRVRITTRERPDALVVPRSALFRGIDGQWQVYAVRDGVARVQTVQVGLINDELAEVTDGVSDGEHVVLAPESNLVDGSRVSLSTEARLNI